MRLYIRSVLLLILIFLWSGGLAGASLPEFSDLAEKAGPAVVNISTVKKVERPDMGDFFRGFGDRGHPFEEFFDQFERFFGERDRQPREQRSLGSGFIISEDGYVVTNNHVVEGADQIKATFSLDDEEKTFDARMVGTDPETDLALIKLDTDIDLPTLQFGNSDDMKVGQWVVAIGNPFGLNHTVTAGIISAKGRVIGAGPYDNFIQTDASINPGNSGGPLLNLQGEVIGINTAIVAAGQGIGFAIPSTMAENIIHQLKTDQKVSRGWLGVTIQNVDQDIASALELEEARGALVAGVTPGDPAEKAGMQAGDVIVQLNGEPVEDSSDLTRKIGQLSPGSEATVGFWREGTKKEVTITLGERDLARLEERPGPEPESEKADLGLSLRSPTQEEAEQLGLREPQGLLVTEVELRSPAHRADIAPGDLILQANGKRVDSIDDFFRILEEDARPKQVMMLLVNRQGQNIFRTIPIRD
ncbi:DegQ family serine endoprotease [Desulfonatronospira sp.]|uniref:DegQ family serine endoprotease n=1 Tax=Desulfonatronospira sp. TaxID=1962951 RepID=UPI0025BE8DAE|nr:DegQ family serine endoprotease [Desulfonatronospira sp.]